MGSLIGGFLARKHPVTLVARAAHVQAIRRDGLRIHGHTELCVHPRAVEEVADAEPPEVVIVTVKSYDTQSAVEALRPFWTSSRFLSLQNGLGNVEALARRAERVLGGVTYHGVTSVGPGEVAHAGNGDTVFGPVQGVDHAQGEEIARAFRECGLAATVTDQVEATLWTKAVVNACFNPLTGVLRARSGSLDQVAWLRECSDLIVGEALAVARAYGVALDRDALLERVGMVARATAQNKSSMLQDLEKGRRTEIDAINGAVSRMGAERGVPCPVNRLLTCLVKASEELARG